MIFETAIHTNMGPRDNLEDYAVSCVFNDTGPESQAVSFGLVADGVGGAQAGELASAMATHHIATRVLSSIISNAVSDRTRSVPEHFPEMLTSACRLANKAILKKAAANKQLKGMSTTVVCFLAMDNQLCVAWAGDSRCYLYSENQLQCLTRDHSEAQDLVDAGILEPEEAEFVPCSHTINRYLGNPDYTDVETRITPLKKNDVLLLATDGLTDVVSDDLLSAYLHRWRIHGDPLQELSAELVQEAIQRGTRDNTTVLCARNAAKRAAIDTSQTSVNAYAQVVAELRNKHSKGGFYEFANESTWQAATGR